MRIKKGMFFIVILIGSLIESANMKEVKAEDSDSIEDIVELSLLYSGSDVTWVAAMETLCDEFMAQNPDIIINTENSGEANCENELKVKEALEQSKRGIYGGAIGYLDFAGNLDTCIAIRLVYKKNGEICIRSGAGIVADSVPEKEFQECCNKARAVVQAIEQAQEGLE